ncbi:Glycogenin-1 [Terramyces sp. JEL0728]|nr:Glycogenin-1 [Terramyces sp. JEL0728]
MSAFATLLTSDLYLPGALVWLKSVKQFTKYPVIIIATKNLSTITKSIIQNQFDKAFFVDTIKSNDFDNLQLLGRPDLFDTFTKIHVFDSTLPFEKICFMDSDTLVLKNIDDVFDYIQGDVVFAAAPDIGWPDCFNSGVFVLKPDPKVYSGDQGLLNTYFSCWPTGSDGRTARLPFGYNVTPTTIYSYLPAFNYYKDQIRVVHFIGQNKPWKLSRNYDGSLMYTGDASEHTVSLIKHWWSIFDRNDIHLVLKELVLDRDWSRYVKPDIRNSSNPSSASNYVQQATQNFNDYKVDWNQNELGRFKQKMATKLATSTAAAAPKQIKKEKSANSLSFYSTRPASPTRSQKSSSPTSITDQDPVIKDINGMYEPGSVLTRVESASEVSAFPDYKVDWNPQELLGKPTAIPIVHDVKVNPLKGTMIKTDSFTISPDGVIHYNDQ